MRKNVHALKEVQLIYFGAYWNEEGCARSKRRATYLFWGIGMRKGVFAHAQGCGN